MSGRRVARFTEKARSRVEAEDWPDGVSVVVEGQSQSDTIHVYTPGGGARTWWRLDPTDLASADPSTVRATAIARLERQGRDPRYSERSRTEDLALAALLRGVPVFTIRPTVTGVGPGRVEGVMIQVNGHDLAGIYPPVEGSDVGWQLGYWDADSGEWVEADPGGDFSRQVIAYLAKERGADG